jgi:hypothetical protein
MGKYVYAPEMWCVYGRLDNDTGAGAENNLLGICGWLGGVYPLVGKSAIFQQQKAAVLDGVIFCQRAHGEYLLPLLNVEYVLSSDGGVEKRQQKLLPKGV